MEESTHTRIAGLRSGIETAKNGTVNDKVNAKTKTRIEYMIEKYNRYAAKEYAKKWAFSRNPKYYNFDPIGGDCTNFISQCILAGSNTMNYTKNTGWYYINGNNEKEHYKN